jgi:hypothetical protein
VRDRTVQRVGKALVRYKESGGSVILGNYAGIIRCDAIINGTIRSNELQVEKGLREETWIWGCWEFNWGESRPGQGGGKSRTSPIELSQDDKRQRLTAERANHGGEEGNIGFSL